VGDDGNDKLYGDEDDDKINGGAGQRSSLRRPWRGYFDRRSGIRYLLRILTLMFLLSAFSM